MVSVSVNYLTNPAHDSVSVVNQYYEAQVHDVFVIKGNAAVFKCNVPSFVSDHLDIISWEDTAGNKFLPPSGSNYGKSFTRLYLLHWLHFEPVHP